MSYQKKAFLSDMCLELQFKPKDLLVILIDRVNGYSRPICGTLKYYFPVIIGLFVLYRKNLFLPNDRFRWNCGKRTSLGFFLKFPTELWHGNLAEGGNNTSLKKKDVPKNTHCRAIRPWKLMHIRVVYQVNDKGSYIRAALSFRPYFLSGSPSFS